MGCKELIESLRAAADEKIKALRREVEQEAGKVGAETARKLEELRAAYSRQRSSTAAEKAAKILSEANTAARLIRLSAEKALSERLYSLAVESLHLLRNAGYRDVFAAFASELPRLPWKAVRVNPEDIGRAKEHFPGAEIISDKHITGGLDVTTEGGKIRVINTFEKRLERAWEEMLPGLLRDVYEEVSRHDAAAQS